MSQHIDCYGIRAEHNGFSWKVVVDRAVFAEGWEPTAVLAQAEALMVIADLLEEIG